MATQPLTQDELLRTLNNIQVSIDGKSYESTWRIAKGTKQTLEEAIHNNTLSCAVKPANASLDGRNISYDTSTTLTMYYHIFCSRNKQVQARLHLRPKDIPANRKPL